MNDAARVEGLWMAFCRGEGIKGADLRFLFEKIDAQREQLDKMREALERLMRFFRGVYKGVDKPWVTLDKQQISNALCVICDGLGFEDHWWNWRDEEGEDDEDNG